MSIQLDGHVTYPYERDNDELPTDGCADQKGEAAAGPITWDGFWYYSQKKSKGGNERCGFKYSFAGPADAKDPSETASAAGQQSNRSEKGPASGAVGAAAAPGERGGALNDPSRSRNVGASEAGVQGRPNAGEQAARGATPATGETSSTSPAAPTANGVASSTTTAGETQSRAPTSNVSFRENGQGPAAPAAGGDGGARGGGRGIQEPSVGAGAGAVDPNKQHVPLTLYGPGGDGRLPSGKWMGYFIVKYGRGVEVKVEETFVLEFGSKHSRTPTKANAASAPRPTTSAAAVLLPSSQPLVSNGDKPQTPAAVNQRQSVQGVPETNGAVVSSRSGAPGVTGPVGENAVATTAATSVVASAPTALAPASTAAGDTMSVATAAATAALAAAAAAAGVSVAPTPSAIAVAAPVAAVATPVTVAPAAPPTPILISPVVRVSGWGHNKYGEFTLTGGHERATGRLDLTRFYYERPKTAASGRSSSGASARGDRTGAGSGVSHQKKKRPPPPGAPPPQPPGPSLAERRTKRTRCPNQRLLDDELISHSSHSETSGAAGGGGGGSSSSAKRRGGSGESNAGAAGSSGDGGAGTTAAAGGAGAGGGGVGTKARKPRDRERDLFMEQSRRARRKAEEAERVAASMSADVIASRENASSGPSKTAAEELAARAEAGREVLAVIRSASEDPVVKVRRCSGAFRCNVGTVRFSMVCRFFVVDNVRGL